MALIAVSSGSTEEPDGPFADTPDITNTPCTPPGPRTVSFAPDSCPRTPPRSRNRTISPPVTPLKPRMDTSTSTHIRDTVNPLIENDLCTSTKLIPFYQWVESAFNVSRSTLDDWANEIRVQRWFADTIIQDALVQYCRSTHEVMRYDPFSKILNRILELGRCNITGILAENAYPFDDLCFVPHNRRPVQVVPEHGRFGAKRSPDIVAVRRSVAKRLGEERANWTDILHFCELKQSSNLIQLLKRERSTWDMVPLRADGLPKDIRRSQRIDKKKAPPKFEEETKKKAKKSAKKKQRAPSEPIEDPPSEISTESVYAGMKRPPSDGLEHRGLFAGRAIANHATTIRNLNPKDPKIKDLDGWDAAIQSGSYAMELLSCTYGTRVSCLGFVLQDDRLYPWFYDPTGVIGSFESISIIADFEKAAAFFLALARCSPEQLGYLPSSAIQLPPDDASGLPSQNLTGYTMTVPHPMSGLDMQLILKNPMFSQYTLVGRHTFLYTASSSPTICKNGLAVKCSYQAVSRLPEQQLLRIAAKAGVKHLPKVHMSVDLWKLSDGVRRIFYEKTGGEADYEDRVLRAIVYTEYSPIKSLFKTRPDLIPVMVDQMINCLFDLRYKANMLHRDISVNNIMYQVRNGKYYFILIDFDMAIVAWSPKGDGSTYVASSKFRTGTLPFMAHTLVRDAARGLNMNWRPIRHCLCHDIESLFWVSLWCALVLFLEHIKDADERRNLDETVQAWEKGKLKAIAAQKQVISVNMLTTSDIVLPEPTQQLGPWFDAWTRVFQLANHAITDREWDVKTAARTGAALAPFDEETMGGTLSRDNLKKYLTPEMPTHQEAFIEDELVSDDDDANDEVADAKAPDQDDTDAPAHNPDAPIVSPQETKTQAKAKTKATAKAETKIKAKAKTKAEAKAKTETKPKTKTKTTHARASTDAKPEAKAKSRAKSKVASAMAAVANNVRARLRPRNKP